MNLENLRISKLKEYLFKEVKKINNMSKDININALSKDINYYSLDRIPTDIPVEKWVNGKEIHRDLYSFRSRCAYSYNEIGNLKNIGFFEIFERAIKSNNEQGILPEIDGIQKIECMNCGSMATNEVGTAEFDIQIQITYLVEKGV